jgi:hypothetical protein
VLCLIKDTEIRNRAEKLLKDIAAQFFSEAASSTPRYHQAYPGGLGDHSLAVAFEAYFLTATRPHLDVDLNSSIISGLFHDIDKLGRYLTKGQLTIMDDYETCKFLAKYGLMNDYVQNGIHFAHGGWAREPDGKLKQGTHTFTAIITHDADMTASQQVKDYFQTRKLIVGSLNRICWLNSLKNSKACPFCDTPFLTPDTLTCSGCKVSFKRKDGLLTINLKEC